MNLGKRREDQWRDEDVAVSSENGLSSVPKPLMNLDSKCRNLTDPVIPIYSARPDQVKKALNYVYHAATNKLEGKELELLIAILPDNNGSLYGISFAHNFHLFKPEPSWHLPLRWICCFCLLLPRIAASLGFPR